MVRYAASPPSGEERTNVPPELPELDVEGSALPNLASSKIFLRFSSPRHEEAFVNTQLNLTDGLFLAVVGLVLIVAILYTTMTVYAGQADPLPLAAALLSLVATGCAASRRTAMRRGLMAFVGVYLNLWIGTVMLPEAYHPTTVKQGHPLPYALLGPSLVFCAGSVLGLRPMADVLPWALFTSLTGALHLWVTFAGSKTIFSMYIGIYACAVWTSCLAWYHLESQLRRRWMWSPLAALDDVSKRSSVCASVTDVKALSAEYDSKFSMCVLKPNDKGGYIHGDLLVRDDYQLLLCSLPWVVFALVQSLYSALRGYWCPHVHVSAAVGIGWWLTQCAFFGTYAKRFGVDALKGASPRLRTVMMVFAVMYINTKVVLGTPFVLRALVSFFPDTVVPTPAIVQEGHPLPLAVMGSGLVLPIGKLFNVRATPLLWVCFPFAVLHVSTVMADTPAALLDYLAVLLTCSVSATVAFYKAEHDLEMMWRSFVHANKRSC